MYRVTVQAFRSITQGDLAHREHLAYSKAMSDEPSDVELLNQCVEGDRRAWSLFVQRFSRYVYYLIQVTGRRHGAHFTQTEVNDLHNDLFVALMEDDRRRLRHFRGANGCSVRSWIRIITIRLAIDSLRKRRKHVSLDATRDDGSQIMELVDPKDDALASLVEKQKLEKRKHLASLTDTLSATDKLLLEMIYVRKMGADAIASALNLKKGALYTRKTRLIQRLRAQAMSKGLIEEEP